MEFFFFLFSLLTFKNHNTLQESQHAGASSKVGVGKGAGEMVRLVRTLAVLAEDSGCVSRTHMAAHSHL